MNTKLEVVRLTNKDVIATSGICSHLNVDGLGEDPDHIYVYGTDGTYYFANLYSQGDKLTYDGDGQITTTYFETTPEVNTWYYWSTEGYKKCDNQSVTGHPIKTN